MILSLPCVISPMLRASHWVLNTGLSSNNSKLRKRMLISMCKPGRGGLTAKG